MKKILALMIASALMHGCAVYTPAGSVVVDPAGTGGHGDGNFCPPGQAKKGNC
ncbi:MULTISPECIES: hypothetical protein [Limnobacter]|uniref:Vir-repressed protein n=1 Tax=Limnobacter litoralis TaxID=481366 RepID=A0ABQ5YV30_9BURK|nr:MULTISPECIES: hypothetical protein [Limnobacter]GLR26629.1 vir-repressed protein [Limnobacter litoralis]HEX5484970.1 hypothetical protein [Limnobacter sp.]